MRYINTIDDTIQFIDVDNTITNVPVNGVYTFIKGDTISFILLRRLDNEGYCVMTTRASDVEINGTVYSIDDYIDGTATQDLYTATGLRLEVVEELPDEGQSGVIYLVPNEDDTYDEYIWLEDEERFEKVGNTDVDLSDYYTKSEVDTLLANYVTSTVFNNLVDEVEENGRVTAAALVDLDETKQDVISDLNTIRSGAALGATALQSSDLNGYATETYVDTAVGNIDLSNYYTKAQIDTAIENDELAISAALNDLNTNKQDVIGDLSTIRSGAALGATALQSYTETDPVFGISAAAGITANDINNWNGLDTIIRDDEEVIAAALNQLNSRINTLEAYHTYHYAVQLVDGSNYYTLDEDVITEDIPQGTLFEISVTRFQGNSYTGENLQCGDFTITLESNNSPITVSSCQFTTASVNEQAYTLTIEVDNDILDYDFTLENTGL